MDPASGLSEHMDILVKDGKITRIAPDITDDSEEIIEAKGLVVAPGLIDTHIHFRDPGFTYKEDIHTGAKASAKGGFTTVICMANTSPTVDNVDTLKVIWNAHPKKLSVSIRRRHLTFFKRTGRGGYECFKRGRCLRIH